MTPERLKLFREMEARYNKAHPKDESLVEVGSQTEQEINSKNHNPVDVVAATILGAIPVSHSEIRETVAEELPAYREAQRDEETASEALTADER